MDAERRTDPTTPQALRFVAPGPASELVVRFGPGPVAFHGRLTVIDAQDPGVDALVGELRDPAASTIVNLDGGPRAQLRDIDLLGPACSVLDSATLEDRLAQTIVGALAELGRQAAELDAALAASREQREAAASQVAALCVRLDAANRGVVDESSAPTDPAALADELAAIDAEMASTRPRATIVRELKKWQRVTDESRARLVQIRESGARVHAADLSEAIRLRNEWQYAEQVHRELRRRRSRRELDESRTRYEQFLAHYGATSYEDLSVVGTGFGNSESDMAIREAATVVSMAEQQCVALDHELAQSDHSERLQRRGQLIEAATEVLGHAPGADAVGELRATPVGSGRLATRRAGVATKVDASAVALLTAQRDDAVDAHERLGLEVRVLERERAGVEGMRRDLSHDSSDRFGSLGPAAVEALLRKALETGLDADIVTPVVIDRALAAAAPAARRRAFEVVVEHSRTRQVILAAKTPDVLEWARALGPDDATVWSVE